MEVLQQTRELKFFPITMYAIVMGLGGLTIMYQKAAVWFGLTHLIGDTLGVATTAIFLIISFLYIKKSILHKEAIKQEFSHPVKVNFFAAISISLLMLSIIYKELLPSFGALFWYIGVVGHFYLTMHTIAFWINHNQQLEHSNPAWFIPIVGNVLVPLGGSDLAPVEFLTYFFSIGIFFWVILFSLILNRIIFHNQMATKFMPTLFILIAPPAVGFISYIKLFGELDHFAAMLFNLALFFTLLLAFMYKNFIKIKFFLSWWAFIFPLSAMTISSMLFWSLTRSTALLVFSYFMLFTTTIIVLIVAYQTIKQIAKQEICVSE